MNIESVISKYLDQNFIYQANNPLHWLNTAEMLYKCSLELNARHQKHLLSLNKQSLSLAFGLSDYIPVANHLLGLSIENLLKAILVERNFFIINKAKMPKAILDHDLPKLYKSTKINKLPGKAVEDLKLLKEFILWLGKYPLPTESKPLRDCNDKYDAELFSRGNRIYIDLKSELKIASR